jgi:hypothetical protein
MKPSFKKYLIGLFFVLCIVSVSAYKSEATNITVSDPSITDCKTIPASVLANNPGLQDMIDANNWTR